VGTPGDRARQEYETRIGVAWTLRRLAPGETWELDGFRTPAEREAYQALVAEVSASRGIPITLHGEGRHLRVVREQAP
jgi:hypothetical protein